MPLPWSRKQGEDLPKELEGLEPKDLVDAITKAKEVDELRKKISDQETQLSDYDATKNRIAELESRLAPPTPPPDRTKPTSFLENEDQAFNERMAPFAIATLQNQAQTAKFMARNSLKPLDAKIWDKYQGEIDAMMANVQLNFQAIPQTWINALDTVRGRHLNDILKMQEDKSDFFSEVAGGTGGGGPRDEEPASLSAEEKKVAQRMGLKEEDYIKYKKEAVVRA